MKCMLPTNLILDPRDIHSRPMPLTFLKDPRAPFGVETFVKYPSASVDAANY